MSRLILFALVAALCCSPQSSWAQASEISEASQTDMGPEDVVARRAEQMIYKGLVGNLLETLPLDPMRRVELQRTNAVVSGPVTARSIAMVLGVASPLFMFGGLLWGLWAASRIEEPEASPTGVGPLTHALVDPAAAKSAD